MESQRHRILLLDDDTDLLEMYREVLAQLPSHPEVLTATTGGRAMALLDGESFSLFICDLRMPKMDGLQVLSIVRKKHPTLRTVVLTSLEDEQFRSRVYALGVDLFWQKPGTEQEIQQFKDCIESLLGQEGGPGFRGMQSKSLVDIIQLECLTHSSSVLHITSGPLTGKIWIQEGDLIDAESDGARGEQAFAAILAWKTGNFETMPAEPNRPRTIFKSCNALLLETAQALDESRGAPGATNAPQPSSGLALLSQMDGVEFLLSAPGGGKGTPESRGVENPDRVARWTLESLERFRLLGDQLNAGPLNTLEGRGPQRNVALTQRGASGYAVGWSANLSSEEVMQRMKKVIAIWAS